MTLPYNKLPEQWRGGLERYFESHIQPGHFLTAVLENDLYAAIARADENANRDLLTIVRWLYNEAPGAAYGSAAKVRAWLMPGNQEST